MSAPISDLPQPSHAIADALDRIVMSIGHWVAWANALLIFFIILNVVLRYGFGLGHPSLEELQWHLYAVAVMFGVAYAQSTNSHVRVDVVAMRMSPKTSHFWEIFGLLFFLLPFVAVIFWHSIDFFMDAWRINERSDAPLGLPWRWAIKAVIPISFFMLGMACIARLLRETSALIREVRRGSE